MKHHNIVISAAIAVSLTVCPCTVFINTPEKEKSGYSASEVKKKEYISVMSSKTGKIEKTEMREYIIGCVAAEMSPLCHIEALKAQAAASYTYAVRMKEKNSSKLADISDSPSNHQGYKDEAQRRTGWGENYEKYETKIEEAVDAVSGMLITYGGEPALTVYHGISAGKTQSGKNMWGGDYPYLQSVESPGDKLSPDYREEYSFTEAEFTENMKKCGAAAGDGEEAEISENSDGYVSFVKVCGSQIPASDIRDAFSLGSTCFTLEHSDGKYIFTCLGKGHGVGMSQYGADYMARQGSNWQDIIKHYYKGVEIQTT